MLKDNELFNKNDGGASVSCLKDKNSCAVRSIAIALEIRYDFAHIILIANGRKNGKGTYISTFEQSLKEFQKVISFKYFRLPIPLSMTIKTRDFIKSYTTGTYIIVQKSHITTCVNGVMQDTFMCLEKNVLHAYKIDLSKITV